MKKEEFFSKKISYCDMESLSSAFQNQMILGLGCLELDTNQEILLAWQYPNVEAIHPQITTFVQQQPFGFTIKKLENDYSYAYYKFHEFWIYQVTTPHQSNGVVSNSSVLQASFFVITKVLFEIFVFFAWCLHCKGISSRKI